MQKLIRPQPEKGGAIRNEEAAMDDGDETIHSAGWILQEDHQQCKAFLCQCPD